MINPEDVLKLANQKYRALSSNPKIQSRQVIAAIHAICEILNQPKGNPIEDPGFNDPKPTEFTEFQTIKFKDAPIGSKIMLSTVVGLWSLIARKTSPNSAKIIQSKYHPINPNQPPIITVLQDEDILFLEPPHADGDFSYFCSSPDCPCHS